MAEEVLVSVAIEEILKKLSSFAFEEIKLACGLKGELKNLSKTVTMIQAVLRDAEGRQVREESVRLWLKDLRSVAYDAEDLLDEFAFEILRHKLELQNRMRNKVRNFFSISNPIAFRFKMAHKVKNINMMFDQIDRRAKVFRLEKLVSTDMTTNRGEFRLTHPFGDDSEVVGRDDDISKIVDKLLDSDNEEDLSIIAMVGMAGLGKTTLAQEVYKKETVRRHFDERMIWVCVSTDFDIKRFLKEMVESLTKGNCDMSNIEAIVKKLKEELNGKKYLLVLDDVWNTDPNKWEGMRKSLLSIGASRGSKIMVTTRSDEVVSTMKITFTHHLAGLSDKYSWFLFKQRAFASGGVKETSNLVDVGRRIVKRCGGLPLAIKTLGALMHSKKEEHEWLSIQHSEIWNLPEGQRRIMPLLRLSLDNLSPCLKQCFAYCSVFLKDFTIEKEYLIQLWMAQGFLQPSQGSNLEMEDIGDDYFKVLLWNSLFQDAEMDMYGNIKNVKMHDLVHDLAQSISGSQCLTLGPGEVNDNLEAQHLSVIPNGEIRPTIPRESGRKLRTFILRDDFIGNSLLNLKCLRVLNLNEANIEELPPSIGKLKHLRYLDVSMTRIKALPKSIGKLYNLQTLRLLMKSWRGHIELPNNLKYLISLRHIYFDKFEMKQMPIEMGQLSSLQTLPFFFVGQERGYQIEELGCLNKLRGKLNICNLEHVRDREDAKRANLSGKTNIYKLGFEWSSEREGGNNDEDVLEGLQPHPNLKGLTIENFGGENFPSWMMMRSINSSGGSLLLDNLVEIKLIDCNRCEQIPTLGKLPSLKVLVISGMGNVKCIGTEFYDYSNNGASGSNGGGSEIRALFPALKIFTLMSMENLVEWMEAIVTPAAATKVVFPCLEELTLVNCPRLTTAPTHFSCLRKLDITHVNSSMPLKNVSSNLTTLTSLQIESVQDLTFLPDGLLQNNKNLASLQIWNCDTLTYIAPRISGCCTSLRSLLIIECNKLSYLPDGLHTLMSLEELIIINCPNLESIPTLHGLASLHRLEIRNCDGLTSIPTLHGLASLHRLEITNCDGLTSIPSGLQSCTSLEDLNVGGCSNLISVPEYLSELRSLSSLGICHCGKLKGLPEGLHCLTRLKTLGIGGFWEELDSFPNFEDILQLHLASLRSLKLYGWPKLKSLPDQLQHLTALTYLYIENFKGVEALPEWLGNLSSLEGLSIWSCKNLMYLPTVESMRRLTKLRRLEIYYCPLLKERCTKGSGPEWFKISRIPTIEIDAVDIQSQAA